MSYDPFENDWDYIGSDATGQPLQENSLLSSFEGRSHLLKPSSLPKDIAPIKHVGKEKNQCCDPFIKGPLCREWLVRASILQKTALRVGLALYFKAGVRKDDFIRGKRAESKPIKCDRSMKTSFKISPSQMSRGLHALKRAGLIQILKGGPGRCPVVAIINIQRTRNSEKYSGS